MQLRLTIQLYGGTNVPRKNTDLHLFTSEKSFSVQVSTGMKFGHYGRVEIWSVEPLLINYSRRDDGRDEFDLNRKVHSVSSRSEVAHLGSCFRGANVRCFSQYSEQEAWEEKMKKEQRDMSAADLAGLDMFYSSRQEFRAKVTSFGGPTANVDVELGKEVVDVELGGVDVDGESRR